MAKSVSVTSAGVNPADDRAHRMRMYFIAMVLRVLCVVSLFWVRGWWILLVAAGAVLLPWFAVMVGNAVAHGDGEAPEAPEPLQLASAEDDPAQMSEERAPEVIVIDVEPTRRSNGAGSPDGAGGAGSPDEAGAPDEAGSPNGAER
ncbi:DUF3099 domain-containing protein [Leucobacter chromiireducens]|uniref:DUF3099 domain-containing protein n=1 Tax=Leucobacter chromiireducens TaxID=283877 RepID=UPI000F62DD20|nr:DUF3099 domain-containing protein [Leucobacter chromiireducens]